MSAVDIKTQTSVVPWWLVLIQGIAALIVGILLITVPVPTIIILVQFLGIYWLITSVLAIVSIFTGSSGWFWKLVSGVLGIAAGFIIIHIQHPLWSAIIVPTILIIVIAALGIIMGISLVVLAFRGGGWGEGILGALSVILGVVLLLNPYIALIVAVALPFVLGAFATVGGLFAIESSFSLRRAPAMQAHSAS
jgi:uncharacterized membrane protein HdeD (DUF308 family)